MDTAPVPVRKSRFAGQWVRLLVVGVVVLSLGSAALIYHRSTGRAIHDADHGPVRTESDTTTSIRADVGQVVTFGGIVLENFSDRPAVLESITIDPPLDSGMTLVDVKVAGRDRGIGMYGADAVFPPSGIPTAALHPLPGAIVPPKQEEDDHWGVEVLMAFRLNRPGQFGFNHTLVDYRIGGKRHRIRVADGFVICGGPDYPTNCNTEAFAVRGD
ncbi:MAG: hypothetical protein ACRDZ7_13635 [Acidimicrobiia bacterium]